MIPQTDADRIAAAIRHGCGEIAWAVIVAAIVVAFHSEIWTALKGIQWGM
jgi:hypothetical protein